MRTGEGTIRAGKGTIRAGQDILMRLILQLILKYKSIIKTNLNLTGFFSRNNLPKMRDGEYVVNLDAYKSIGTL